jgi:hypothetical protein
LKGICGKCGEKQGNECSSGDNTGNNSMLTKITPSIYGKTCAPSVLASSLTGG